MSKGKQLHTEEYNKQEANGIESDSKQIALIEKQEIKQRKHKPSKHHPWNQ